MPFLPSRRGAAATAVAVAGLLAAAPAHAAPFNAGEVAGAQTSPGILTGPVPGQVAVAGRNLADALVVAAHASGGAFGTSVPVATGTSDEPAVLGTGGAVMAPGALGPVASRVRPDGTVSAPVTLGGPGSTSLGAAAVAPSGALLAAITNDEGDMELWRQAADGTPAAPLTASLPDNASVVDVEPTGPDSFIVLVAAPAVSPSTGIRVRAYPVTGGTVGAVRVVDDASSATGAALVRAVGGAAPFGFYVLSDTTSSTARAAALSGAPVPAKTLTSVSGEDNSIDDLRGLGLAGGGAAVAWTTSDLESSTAAYAVLDPAANVVCSTGEPFSAVALVDRGGPLLVGLDASERVATVPVAAGCPAGTPSAGPAVPGAVELDAAVEADGTLVTAVTRGLAGGAAVVVDDITPPEAGAIQAPAEVRPRQSFEASVTASDPWGVSGYAWSVNGEAVTGGASASIPGQPAGTARVKVAVTNQAGLEATREVEVRVRAVEQQPEQPRPQTTPTTPTPAPGPTSTESRDATPPVLSGVRLERTLIRPLRATRRLSRGTALRFAVNEDARYRVTLLREAIRPRVRSRCDLPGGTGQSGRTGRIVELQGAMYAGALRLPITGRDRAGRRLPRGRYRVSVRVIDAAGNWSQTRYVHLTLC